TGLESELRQIGTVDSVYRRLCQAIYPLKERRSFATLVLAGFSSLRDRLEEILRKARRTEEFLAALDHDKITPAYTWLIIDRLEKIVPALESRGKSVMQKMRLWWWTSFTGKRIIEELLGGKPFRGTSSAEWPRIRENLRLMYDMAKTTETMCLEQ